MMLGQEARSTIMTENEGQSEETDDIPPELRPAPDPAFRSVERIVAGAMLVVLSVGTWEMGIAMEPAVVEVWKQLLPVAPFGQLLPAFLIDPFQDFLSLDQTATNLSVVAYSLALAAPLLFASGLLRLGHGIVWTWFEYFHSVRRT